jgi:anti-sigma B factor antagonist
VSITTEHVPEGAVLTVAGSLDMATADQLEEAVRPCVRAGGVVIVDLAGVSMCDSTGLGAIVRVHRQAKAEGCQVAVRAPRPYLAALFAMTGLNKVIEVRSS